MSAPSVDVVFFPGCPHVDRARENVRRALEELGYAPVWSEWDAASESTPERLRGHGSPTVLVEGRDVTGAGRKADALACRVEGAPSVEAIRRGLRSGP